MTAQLPLLDYVATRRRALVLVPKVTEREQPKLPSVLYSHHVFSKGWTPHRVLKVTADYLYIDNPERESDLDAILRRIGAKKRKHAKQLRISRRELERYGRAFHRMGLFSPTPDACGGTPRAIAALGLTWPCTITDIKSAYRRKAATAHPDRGGSDRAFTELSANYRAALAAVGGA